jgi:hypothetical protein
MVIPRILEAFLTRVYRKVASAGFEVYITNKPLAPLEGRNV